MGGRNRARRPTSLAHASACLLPARSFSPLCFCLRTPRRGIGRLKGLIDGVDAADSAEDELGFLTTAGRRQPRIHRDPAPRPEASRGLPSHHESGSTPDLRASGQPHQRRHTIRSIASRRRTARNAPRSRPPLAGSVAAPAYPTFLTSRATMVGPTDRRTPPCAAGHAGTGSRALRLGGRAELS